MNDEKPPVAPDGATDETDASEDIGTLQQELRILVHDQLQLAAVELRLAAHSLANMISVTLAIVALLVMAWAGLMTAGVLGLIRTGLQPAYALLLVTALTAILAILLAGSIRHWSRHLGFPASLRALMPSVDGAIEREAK